MSTAGREVKFGDPSKTTWSESACQACTRLWWTKVRGSKM